MKKFGMILAATAFSVVCAFINPSIVSADALPCTYDTINDAQAQKSAALQNLAAAEQALNAAQANFNAVKASNPSELELTIAGNAVTSAQDVVRWYTDQVTNAQAFLDNINQRAVVEDNMDKAVTALGYLNNYQSLKLQADNAQDIANSALQRVKDAQNVIIGYQNQLATSPSLQATIDSLNTQLVTLTADYETKQAVADQQLNLLAEAIAADGYQSYDKAAIDYINHRLITRGKPEINCIYKDDVPECTPEKKKSRKHH